MSRSPLFHLVLGVLVTLAGILQAIESPMPIACIVLYVLLAAINFISAFVLWRKEHHPHGKAEASAPL